VYRGRTKVRSDLGTKRICAHCGKEFAVKTIGAVCCGVKCASQLRGEPPITVLCEQCGAPFEKSPKQTNHRFCSVKCRNRHTNEQRFGPTPQSTCIVCGKTFRPFSHHTGKFCSRDCLAAYNIGPNNPMWKGGWETYYGPNWRRQRRRARKRDGYKCQHCGVSESKLKRELDVHHIQPFRDFGGDYQKANRLSNLISLCAVCHKRAEHHTIPIQPTLPLGD